MMHLQVMQPTEILIDQAVAKITAEGQEGSFCLLPQHVDLVAALVPGILALELEDGEEVLLAIDDGILVKQGASVRVSVRNAVRGDHLEALQQAVQQQFRHLDEREQQARHTLAHLETSFIRELIDLGGNP
jgi:F-type H+-transporting ATPase subunit epsilon